MCCCRRCGVFFCSGRLPQRNVRLQFVHHFLELRNVQRLRAVTDRFFRRGMHFYDQAVRANRNARARANALTRPREGLYTGHMEVHFTPEQEARLSKIATQEGIGAEKLVKDAALRLLEDDVRFRAGVRKGLEQADRGEFVEEEEMDARFKRMFRS
jgi:predicted transcriptional regulator